MRVCRRGNYKGFIGILVEVGKEIGVSQHRDTSVVVKGSKMALECLCDLTPRNAFVWLSDLERSFKDECKAKV